MTWQSIGENTYIDDSLVTCAEYQLFIDEMLGQGKYYQPDHWVSYQFTVGQAREPILGVRQSDAVAFCEWLTKRGDGWQYHLPASNDANKYLLRPLNQSLLGYWVTGSESKTKFVWAGRVPNNPRNININQDYKITYAYELANVIVNILAPYINIIDKTDYARAHEIVLDLTHVKAIAFSLTQVQSIAIDLGHALSRELSFQWIIGYTLDKVQGLIKKLEHNLNFDRRLVSDIGENLARIHFDTRALAFALERACDYAPALDIDKVLARAREPSFSIQSHRYSSRGIVFDRYIACTIDLALDRDLNRAHAVDRATSLYWRHLDSGDLDNSLDRSHHIDIARLLTFMLSVNLGSILMSTMYLYVDLLTLSERIVGCSPAFEGIRLVKEWIK